MRQQVKATHAEDHKRLLTVPGIGSITAMKVLAETGDLYRFDDPDEYTRLFAGLNVANVPIVPNIIRSTQRPKWQQPHRIDISVTMQSLF